jgi:subtilisin family serine protease
MAESKVISPAIEQQLKASGVAQVIVVLKSAGQAMAASGGAGAGAAALRKHFTSSELSQRSALAAAPAAGTRTASARRRSRPAPAVMHFPNLGVMLGTVTPEGLAALRDDDAVATVAGTPQISLIRPEGARAARAAKRVTWGIDALGVPALWSQGLTGKGVRVAHLDTGVDGRHPALKRAIRAFAEFDDLGVQVTPVPRPWDSDDHGTHTAATIAGRPVRGRSIGVAPGAELVSAMVIEGGDVVARVLGGLDWSLEQGVRVLSMSLGFRGWWEDFLPIVQILRARNVLPVIAVGNEGPGTSRSPGNYSEALSVGAVDVRGRVAGFSSSQRFQRANDPRVPDVVAPGVDVISAEPGRGYQSMDGTSMATPHVAGLAALLCEAAPDRGVNDLEDAIFRSCRLASGVPPSRANRGVPDAVAALQALTGLAAAVRPSTIARRRRR